jgi:hypothetical protein
MDSNDQNGQSNQSGIDLDLDALDNPHKTLATALAQNDSSKAMGAWRLLATSGKEPNLSSTQALLLSHWMQELGMFLDAARILRIAAEKNLADPASTEALYKSACILMGPANKPKIALQMLTWLTEKLSASAYALEADKLIELYESDQKDEIFSHLQQAGVIFPVAEVEKHITEPGIQENKQEKKYSFEKKAGFKMYAFLIVLGLLLISWFFKDDYKGVDKIHPDLKKEPIQKPLAKETWPIRFTSDEHHIQLAPKFHYDLHGLIVGKNDYSFLGLSRGHLVYQMDLCTIWGSNVKDGVYNNPGLEFVQAGNVCYARWDGSVRLKGRQLSNNHIIVNDPGLEDAFDDLDIGDQIRIKGYLVDVKAQPIRDGFMKSSHIKLETSTSRTDKNLGACEIIYAEDLEVLVAGTPIWRLINKISFWIVALFVLVFLVRTAWPQKNS